MRVAVFGPDGMLGKQVLKALAEVGYERKPIYRRMVNILSPHSVAQNIEDCDAVINCAGVIPTRGNVVEMILANSLFPHVLVTAAATSPVVLVSTDCVFSGRSNSTYNTTHATDAGDYYGRSKALGEVVAPNALVVRTSFIGCDHGFLNWLLSADYVAQSVGETQKVHGWKNALWTGSTVTEVAKELVACIDPKRFCSGVVHMATQGVISKFDLARKLVDYYNLDLEVVPSLHPSTNRALKPNITLPDIDEALSRFECKRRVAGS